MLESDPISCSEFVLRSKRGKLELDISRPIRCPFLNTFEVAHRSIVYSYTDPG